MFKLEVRHGNAEVLEKIVNGREMGIEPNVPQVLTANDLSSCIELARKIFLPQPVANFIARIVDATHGLSSHSEAIKYGASPRAALALASSAKARALLHGRMNASFEDVQTLAPDVLCHRLILDYRSKLQGISTRDITARILEEVRPLDKAIPKMLTEDAQR